MAAAVSALKWWLQGAFGEGEGGEKLKLTCGLSAFRTHERRSETCASWCVCIAAVEVLEVIVGISSSAAAKYGHHPSNCTEIR